MTELLTNEHLEYVRRVMKDHKCNLMETIDGFVITCKAHGIPLYISHGDLAFVSKDELDYFLPLYGIPSIAQEVLPHDGEVYAYFYREIWEMMEMHEMAGNEIPKRECCGEGAEDNWYYCPICGEDLPTAEDVAEETAFFEERRRFEKTLEKAGLELKPPGFSKRIQF